MNRVQIGSKEENKKKFTVRYECLCGEELNENWWCNNCGEFVNKQNSSIEVKCTQCECFCDYRVEEGDYICPKCKTVTTL